MSFRYLLIPAICILTFCNSVSAQKAAKFYGDSLDGFDEKAFKAVAQAEGLSGAAFKAYINVQKRYFIDVKYNLLDPDAHAVIPPTIFKNNGGSNQILAAPCSNEGFENGSLSSWTGSIGTNANSSTYPTFTNSAPSGYTAVVTTPFNDTYVGSIPNSPLGGSVVAVINNSVAFTGAPVIMISQSFPVTTTNYIYDFAYWAVLEDAPGHNCTSTPYMSVRVRNNGTLTACPNFSIIAPGSGGGCTGIGPLSWTQASAAGHTVQTSSGWQRYSINLSAFSGPVTIEVIVAHCSATGHFGYAYFDSNCGQFNLRVNGTQTVNMPTSNVNVQVPCASTATMVAPLGFNPYSWNGPTGSSTSGTMVTSTAGIYTLNMNPVGGCAPGINRFIDLKFAPPTTVTASPATICAAGTNTASTLSASGASSYLWSTGQTGATISVSPLVTTIYTVTATSGTCVGVFTVQVTIAAPPTINISASQTTVCSGPNGTVTLTGSGGTSYVWSPGGSSSNPITVTPPTGGGVRLNTTYTLTGFNATGCSATRTIVITSDPTATITALRFTPVTGSICIGDQATLLASGGTSAQYTWTPGAIIGNIVFVSPVVNTTYSAVGTNQYGTCPGISNTVIVMVDPGPPITVAATPTITCPGVTATLTANAPSAVGSISWNPGGGTGTTFTVNPLVTTTYSVNANNLAGCGRTVTIVKFVAPSPTISFAPTTPTVCLGSSITLTASGGTSYTWTSPAPVVNTNTKTVSPVVNTAQFVSVNNGSCTSSASVMVTVVQNPTVIASVTPTAICVGGSATLSGTGANTWAWLPGGMTTATAVVSPTLTTTYTVTGNTAGCSNTKTVTLVVNPLPTVTVAKNPSSVCPGFCATLTPSGAQTYTYLNGGPIVCPTVTTTYSVSGTSSLGCISAKAGTVSVIVNPTPLISLSPASATICQGGSVQVTASGATGYTWAPGGMTTAIVVLTPTLTTNYTVTGVNVSGCIRTRTITVTVNLNPTVSASAAPATICNGASSTLTALGATSFTWYPGGTSNPITVSPISTIQYTVIGRTNGCEDTTNVTVTVNPRPTIGVAANPTAVCVGVCATLIPSGASTYTYLNGGPVVCPSVTTTYSVSGTSALGCVSATPGVVTVILTPPPTISASPSSTTICAGQTASIILSGGVSYTTMPGSIPGSNLSLSPGVSTIYTVTGANSGGCIGTTTINITVNPIPVITASASPATICLGNSSTLTASGATSFVWQPGGGTGSPLVVTPVATTIYTVTGTSLGCAATRTVSVTVNPRPTIGVSASQSTICAGSCATLTPSGAVSYTFLNGGPIVCPSVTTTYSVAGTNAFGCTSNSPGVVTIVVNPVPAVFAVASSASVCAGSSATLSAGNASTYTWQPVNVQGQTIVVTPVSSTTYTVFGTAAGCTGSATVAVAVLSIPVVSASASPATICRGGTSNLTASGASSYVWNPGASSSNPFAVTPTSTTIYTVTGTTSGCSGTRTVMVTVNPLPTVGVAASPTAVCPGVCATLTPSGASTYTYMNGGPVVCPSVTTTYSVMGTSALGCVSSLAGTVTVIRNSSPTIFALATQTAICAGQSTTLMAAGATSFTWFPGALPGASVVVTPPSTTNYTVFGTSACTGSAIVTVVVNPIPIINASASPASICQGDSTTLNASGASSYVWQPVNQSGSSIIVSPVSTTIYTVTGMSAAGCSGTRTVLVTVNPRPTLGLSASSNTICAGSCVTLTPSGAVSYTFLNGGPIVCPSVTTTYSVIGKNAFGCAGLSPGVVVVNVNPIPSVSVSPTSTSICLGTIMSASASGANSYLWIPGNLTTANVTVSPSSTTIYTVTGTSLGCSKSTTMLVVVNPKPNVNVAAVPGTICSGNSSTLIATGANSYLWNPGSLTGNTVAVSPTSNTTYTVVGTNGFGCTDQKTVNVNVNTKPVVSIIASNTTICSGNSATLIGTGANNYVWFPNALTGGTIIVNPSTTTTYTLLGTNGFGCSDTAMITLNVNPTPTINLSANTPSICQGYSVALTATGANNYTWNPGGSNGNTLIDFPSVTTTYTVFGESSGCSSVKFITIQVVPLPNITASANPTSICAGQTVTLTAFGGVTYTWLPSFQTGSLITDAPTVSTSYTVVGQAANGCPNAAIVSVNVNSIPVINASASSPSICIGSSATLTASGGNNYTWTPGPQFTNPIVVSPVSGTTYTVIGDNGTCTGSTTIFVGVNPLPVVSANATPSLVCAGSPVSLNASGAVNYTWQPINQFGSTANDLPTASTTYTVYGEDANGCTNSAMTSVVVNPLPTLIASASATALCEGTSVTLSGSGANSYTWEPGTLAGQVVIDTPLVTTIYTVSGTDANGCIGTGTILVNVYTNPTVVVSPLNSSICIGSGATLTATGANSFTWYPSGTTGSVNVEFPTTASIYTVTGDNGGICFHTTTVAVFVNPLPANVVATVSGTITCASPTVGLFGSSTETTVLYSWNGPLNYYSGSQNPIGVNMWGTYTLNVLDTITGCVATATVDVPTDGSIPYVTATASGSITCASPGVFLNAVHTTTNPGFAWTGPNNFTGTAVTVAVTVAGDYTVIVRDLTSGCSDTAVVTVGTHTEVTITATMFPATCTAGSSNNDGTIMVGNFGGADKFDLVAGSNYTGSATYGSAVVIPTSGIITNNLANPNDTVYYSMRIFDSLGCQKDFVLKLIPVDCSLRSLGIAKSVASPTINADGTYEVLYTIVVQNYDTGPLSEVVITENLSNTFPSPTTFTVMSIGVNGGSNLFENTSFDGVTQTNLTHTTSNLAGTTADTIRFTVRVTANGVFGPFSNTVSGVCFNNINVSVSDISTDGTDPDPDHNGDPKNNSDPTIITFAPDLFFGLTKQGEMLKLDNNTYDISYTISVHNLGNDTLSNVIVKDSLFNNTIRQPATYSIKSGPGASGGLIANAGFNGNSDINLLSSGSKLAPSAVAQITFVINVVPDTVSVISNTAFGSAYNVLSDSTLTDISNSGSNPDGNNNGIWNEPDDNVPTVIVLPLSTARTGTLFIPQGFSPDNDGVNDLWVIKNLPNDGDNSVTIYNRWGNRVYYHANYNNSWDGHPNIAGTVGKGKLPQGTYYFVLELKNTGQKPITGFIELQYQD